MKTRKQIVKEFLDAKAKASVATAPENGEVKSDKKLVANFLKAVANQDRAAIRGMQDDIKAEYKAALTDGQNITNDEDGGYLVPVEISLQIVERLKYVSPIRQYATVVNMNGKTKFVVSEGNPVAYWVDEGEEITRSKVTFGEKEIELNKIAGLGGLTYEAINDTASTPDLQTFLVNKFAEAIAEKELDAFVNGDGVKKPFGFRSDDITPKTTTGTMTYADLVKLKFLLAKPYRDNGVFLASTDAIQSLVGAVDTTGRPLFTAGLADNEGDRLLGRPFIEVNELPADEIWYNNMSDYMIGEGGAIRIDFGTTGNDFETDKISVRVIHRVAGRPLDGDSFAVMTITPPAEEPETP